MDNEKCKALEMLAEEIKAKNEAQKRREAEAKAAAETPYRKLISSLFGTNTEEEQEGKPDSTPLIDAEEVNSSLAKAKQNLEAGYKAAEKRREEERKEMFGPAKKTEFKGTPEEYRAEEERKRKEAELKSSYGEFLRGIARGLDSY